MHIRIILKFLRESLEVRLGLAIHSARGTTGSSGLESTGHLEVSLTQRDVATSHYDGNRGP